MALAIPPAGPCVMRAARPGGRVSGQCGAQPSGFFEMVCGCAHREAVWLCLVHGGRCLAGRPAALCETCYAGGPAIPHRCPQRVKMLAGAG